MIITKAVVINLRLFPQLPSRYQICNLESNYVQLNHDIRLLWVSWGIRKD